MTFTDSNNTDNNHDSDDSDDFEPFADSEYWQYLLGKMRYLSQIGADQVASNVDADSSSNLIASHIRAVSRETLFAVLAEHLEDVDTVFKSMMAAIPHMIDMDNTGNIENTGNHIHQKIKDQNETLQETPKVHVLKDLRVVALGAIAVAFMNKAVTELEIRCHMHLSSIEEAHGSDLNIDAWLATLETLDNQLNPYTDETEPDFSY